ncbi:MAG: dihydrofolate reductase family protein [Solirubrobacteraceae bacterium]|nr:dihydrofolate reductase family protein [Solirubrobacteraceae bacterium]
MSRTTYFTATSLDGFIADPEHSLQWLFRSDHDPDGALSHVPFVAAVGALAMGSSTYEWILRHEGAEPGFRWPYTQPTWVFTSRELPTVDGDVRFVSGDVVPVHAEMVEAAEGRDVWLVGGGELVGRFADAGLLDRVLVSIAPVTLGAGAPLLPRRLRLIPDAVERNRDFACVSYRVDGPEPA